jgi:ComEC/Rec2-related protein
MHVCTYLERYMQAYCVMPILVGLIWLFVGGRAGKRRMPIWLTLLTITMLVIYTAFTGATPSVIRAAIMGAVLLIAPLVGRRYDPMAALAVAAAGMVLLDPYVLADAGFQLSYLAMLGITTLAPAIYALSKRLRLPAVLGLPVATTLAAQAATLPLSILLSGQFTLVSPLATLTADLSLLPLMLSGIITAFIGLFPLISALGLHQRCHRLAERIVAPVVGAVLGLPPIRLRQRRRLRPLIRCPLLRAPLPRPLAPDRPASQKALHSHLAPPPASRARFHRPCSVGCRPCATAPTLRQDQRRPRHRRKVPRPAQP